MEQLLFFTSRARKDTKTAIALLFTQVRILGEYDWGNLMWLLRYIRSNVHLPFILGDDIMSVIKLRVDAYFAAHPEYKGYTGAMMSMVSGSIMELFWKKKLNGRSSTEAQIGGSDDALRQ